ncbi:MAG: SpoIID/LytB domain-containing protein [Leptolyngbya sp. Prado105]|jgi:peptidoglycan hydrolase-like amidase|nr:SpoIID/LytB domain-containing protein [Leptolyngbya sp. Prado105]
MWRKSILEWLKQRPWLLVPFLALIPLAGVYLNQQTHSEPAPLPSPVASPIPSPIALPAPPPKLAQPLKSPAAKKTATPVDPKKYTKEESALNEKNKAAIAASIGTVDSLIEMQVAIAMGQPSLSIAASQGATIIDGEGKTLGQLSAAKAYSVQGIGNQITLGNGQLPGMIMIQPPANGILYLGDKPYRGRFLLAAQGGRVWVVNYINLRHYLHSVVASEVSPSWSAEALKAQAVAARSYALTYFFRRAQPLYHMGSDEYFQVYSGISREAERTNQAVDQTAGEFISYKGGIVESLYAASDDIVAEAFRGKGMSQLGALSLAEQGFSYRQILARYYPKTGIARIEQDY